jgi:hypothetical protein
MNTNEQSIHPEFQLYVIFHGAFAFHDVVGRDTIDIYAPEVAPHVYKMGSYLAEQTVTGHQGAIILSGVEPSGVNDANTMAGHAHVITVKRPIPPSAQYCMQLRVPRPNKIFWTQIVKDVTVKFGMQEDQSLDWAQIPVFAYEADVSCVELLGRYFTWKPRWEKILPITLHVWATAEIEGDDDGTKLAAELLGERVTITAPPKGLGEDLYEFPEIPDLVGREYEYKVLAHQRLARLAKFAESLRDGRGDASILTGVTTAHCPNACGPVGGG